MSKTFYVINDSELVSVSGGEIPGPGMGGLPGDWKPKPMSKGEKNFHNNTTIPCLAGAAPAAAAGPLAALGGCAAGIFGGFKIK